jgi:pyruvate,water dikinase
MLIDPDPAASIVGGKAFQLYRLKEVCAIPAFFTLAFDDPGEIDDVEVQQEILRHFEASGFSSVAVRSSATNEDSTYASFAGMYETVLNVDRSGLISAIKLVSNSINNPRVADYIRARGILEVDNRMNVIVQEMVDGRVSGVCFTRMHDDRDTLIIEACLGLGEALVSGKVSPDSYLVDRETLGILSMSVGYQRTLLRARASGWRHPDYEEVPFHKRNARKLNDQEIRAVAETALSIEKHLQFDSADVEWTFELSNLYVLQARPYTGSSSILRKGNQS